MCACIHVCICVRLNVCMYVFMLSNKMSMIRTNIYVCAHGCMYARNTPIYASIGCLCMCMKYMHMYECILYASMYTMWMYAYIYIYITPGMFTCTKNTNNHKYASTPHMMSANINTDLSAYTHAHILNTYRPGCPEGDIPPTNSEQVRCHLGMTCLLSLVVAGISPLHVYAYMHIDVSEHVCI